MESTDFWLLTGKFPGSALEGGELEDAKDKGEMMRNIFSFISVFSPMLLFSLVFCLGPKMDF